MFFSLVSAITVDLPRSCWARIWMTLIGKFSICFRALDLKNDTVGGSHIEGFPISAIPVLTQHDRGRSTVMAETHE